MIFLAVAPKKSKSRFDFLQLLPSHQVDTIKRSSSNSVRNLEGGGYECILSFAVTMTDFFDAHGYYWLT